MDRNPYLKRSRSPITPRTLLCLDYALCALVFVLIGIASNAQIAQLIASIGR
jgi:hypothetical protein